MPLTPNGLPYPNGSDPFDVPQDIRDLAEAVDDKYPTQAKVSADHYTKNESNARYPQAAITGVSAMHFGHGRVTPNANGKAVINHGAGFTPTRVTCFITDDASAMDGAGGRVINVEADTNTATTFTARIYRNDNGNPSSSPLNVSWIAWKED